MKPKRNDQRLGLALGVLVAVHLLWRLVCFSWQPLNLTTWPGAAFEASALAATGLLVIWLVLRSGNIWWRAVVCLGLYIAFRLLQDGGVMLHYWRTGKGRGDLEIIIFRTVEDDVLYCTIVLALALRLMTGYRIAKVEQPSAVAAATPVIQFRLLHLLILTGVIAGLLGLARAAWFQTAGDAGYGEQQIIFLHAVTIALAMFPALIMLLPERRWASSLAMILTWIGMPSLIAFYFHYARWFPWDWDIVQHLTTIVLGTSIASLLSAQVARRSGFRFYAPVAVSRAKWPENLLPPTVE